MGFPVPLVVVAAAVVIVVGVVVVLVVINERSGLQCAMARHLGNLRPSASFVAQTNRRHW